MCSSKTRQKVDFLEAKPVYQVSGIKKVTVNKINVHLIAASSILREYGILGCAGVQKKMIAPQSPCEVSGLKRRCSCFNHYLQCWKCFHFVPLRRSVELRKFILLNKQQLFAFQLLFKYHKYIEAYLLKEVEIFYSKHYVNIHFYYPIM